MFDPKISKGKWEIYSAVNSRVLGIFQEDNIIKDPSSEDWDAVVAVPELLEVYKAAKVASKMGLGLFDLEYAIEKLEEKHE